MCWDQRKLDRLCEIGILAELDDVTLCMSRFFTGCWKGWRIAFCEIPDSATV